MVQGVGVGACESCGRVVQGNSGYVHLRVVTVWCRE
jgi:hypothetical protein